MEGSCVPPCTPSLAMVPECVLFYIYSHFLHTNPYKCTQEKDVLRKGKVKNGAFIESKISQKHSPSNSKGTRRSRISSYFTAFRLFHSKSTNTSIFQVWCGPGMNGANPAEKMFLISICGALGNLWTGRMMLQRLKQTPGTPTSWFQGFLFNWTFGPSFRGNGRKLVWKFSERWAAVSAAEGG